MSFRIILISCLLTALALTGFGVLAWARHVDSEQAARYRENLRFVTVLDSRLTGEVMKVRSGVEDDYDAIVRAQAALNLAYARLLRPPGFLPEGAKAQLLDAVRRLQELNRQKSDLIERFKSEHAIVHNSVRFLPTLVAQVERDAPTLTTASGHQVSMDGLVRDLLVLHIWYDAHVLERARQSLADLSSLTEETSGEYTTDLGLVLRHAQRVMEGGRRVRQLIETLTMVPTQTQIEVLIAMYDRHHGTALESERMDRMVLFVLAVMLVALIAASVISRLRRSARELRGVMKTLQMEQAKQKQLSELKNRFVSMASHEFRTPLSVIVSSSEMISAYLQSWSDDKKVDHLARIRSAALAMTDMLDAILMIGRTDAGVLEFKPAPVDLTSLCEQVVEAAERSANTHDRIQYSGSQETWEIILDENLLRHILENLLSNALKYSPDGSPVSFNVYREGNVIVFRVRDRGIGIPEEDQEHLFETFHRGGNVGKIAGTGLGLAIVERAVELHNGRLSMHSEVGVGTDFHVYIPSPRSA